MSDWTTALCEAMTLKSKLDLATDRMNEAIRDFEAALAGWSLGVRLSVRLSRGPGAGTVGDTFLCFGKWDNRWRLLVERVTTEGANCEVSLLATESREVRLSAVPRFAALVEAAGPILLAELERAHGCAGAAAEMAASLRRAGAQLQAEPPSGTV